MNKRRLFLTAIIISQLLIFHIHIFSQDNTSDEIIPGTILEDDFGFEMIYVPSGTFQMGIDEEFFRELVVNGIFTDFANLDSIAREASYGVFETYETTLQSFWIDRYELTINQYERSYLRCFETNDCSNNNLPQLLTWEESVSFCAGRGARLATEEEWEYAASGSNNFIFPWGNELNFDLDNNQDYVDFDFDLYEVGSRSQNISWIGVFDMAGNAEEWTDNLYQPYYRWGRNFAC
jgi:formylglycine-generating enzyme required for sulfatase activity